MGKNNEKVVAMVIVMELIMVAAAAADSKVSVRPENVFVCIKTCAQVCGALTGIPRILCMGQCVAKCFKPSAIGIDTDCTDTCAVSMCSQFQNPDDTEKLEGCITDNCVQKCLQKS